MNSEAKPVIAVKDLSYFYGRRKKRVEAIRNVSFEIGRGEIFGLIGPDGAGKTTIIQILAGVLDAKNGDVAVGGVDVVVNPEAVKSLVGYMPQGLGVNLYESLSVKENIEFFRDLRKLPEEIYQRNRKSLLKMTRLEPFVNRRARDLSGGMRQKLALICTLIHLPDVLLLDEPTTGVDPISRQEFWQIIHRLVQERKVTILLSTSYMDEAERCHRIGLVHGGSIFEQGTPESIKDKATGHYATIIADPQTDALRALQARDDVLSTEVFGDEIHFRFEGNLQEISADLTSQRVWVKEIAPRTPSLEDVFLQLLSSDKQQKLSLQLASRGSSATLIPIECDAVTRKFGDFVAVDDVELHVERGEIFGLLGPNGAGKTTLIKMMCGLLDPSAGSLRIAGFDIRTQKERVWTQIGYMSQHFSLYRDLSVQQNLRLYSDLYDVAGADFNSLTASLGLAEFRSRLAGDLPIGLRQRLSLLCAVLHSPPVLFLDEPTSGVDPPARRVFWDLIYSLSRESGVTILVSTHYMDEADHCDRLGLMDQGRLFAVNSPAGLKRDSERRSGKLLEIQTLDYARALEVLVRDFPTAVLYGDRVHFRSLKPASDQRRALAILNAEGITSAQIKMPSLSMDETFIDFIRNAEVTHA